jgi:DNA adenine methylase
MAGKDHLTPCEPVLPIAPYLGGKKNLAARVIALLRETPHVTYAEPFVGMGGIFLRRPWRAKSEVINDLNRDVATLFRMLQRHYEAVMDMLRWQLTSRAEFDRLVAADADTLTDLERAARFLYLQRTAFGGKISGRNFGVSVERPARFDVTQLEAMLAAVHERLASVVIECLPYADFIRRYDRPGTLFYLDPPYEGNEGDYGPGMFTPADFEHLAELLEGLQGRFLLSLNDTPVVRRVFSGFEQLKVDVAYSISQSGSARGRRGELLIGRKGG